MRPIHIRRHAQMLIQQLQRLRRVCIPHPHRHPPRPHRQHAARSSVHQRPTPVSSQSVLTQHLSRGVQSKALAHAPQVQHLPGPRQPRAASLHLNAILRPVSTRLPTDVQRPVRQRANRLSLPNRTLQPRINRRPHPSSRRSIERRHHARRLEGREPPMPPQHLFDDRLADRPKPRRIHVLRVKYQLEARAHRVRRELDDRRLLHARSLGARTESPSHRSQRAQEVPRPVSITAARFVNPWRAGKGGGSGPPGRE